MHEGFYKRLCSNLPKMTKKENVYCIPLCAPNATISERTKRGRRNDPDTGLTWDDLEFCPSSKTLVSPRIHTVREVFTKWFLCLAICIRVAFNSLRFHERESVFNQCPRRQIHMKTASLLRTYMVSSS